MNKEQLTQIEKLGKLLRSGLLTEEEFNAQKKAILTASSNINAIHFEQVNTKPQSSQFEKQSWWSIISRAIKSNKVYAVAILVLCFTILAGFLYNDLKENSVTTSQPLLKNPPTATNKKSLLELTKEAESKFNAYMPQIASSHDARVNYGGFLTGDITNDGLDDVVIYFFLSPKDGGNAMWGHSLVFYENFGNKVKVIGGFEPDYKFYTEKIKDGKIYITKTQYHEEDAMCCPSILTPIELTVVNGKAQEHFFPTYREKSSTNTGN